jgi:single-strand DNA-binding protein
MPNANRVILMGNMTRDPQLKYLPNQTAVVDFGLATNRKFKGSNGEDREDVCFVDCSAFGRTAEIINQYCQKGRPIYIEGRLKYDSWEDKQGGGKRHKLSVVVDNMQLLGGRDGGPGQGPDAGGGGEQRQSRPPAGRPAQRNAPQSGPPDDSQEPPLGNEQHFNDSDIPF